MKNKKKIAFILLLLAIIIVAFFCGFYFFGKSRNENELILYGNIDIRQAELGFRVFGRLKTMYVEEGDETTPGELLAELDPAPYENSLKEAEWRVSSIKNNLQYANAQLERRDLLVKGKSVSEEDYQKVFYNQKVLLSNLEEALAAYENAKINLDDTKLHAPSVGVIFTRVREPGTVLNPGDPVYVLSVSSPIWARAYVSEPDLGKIYPGMKAKVYTDTDTNPVYEGHVGFISPTAEFTPKNVETPELRTDLVYQLRVVIDNPDKGLRQGMPVTIKFHLDHEK